nr:hypothetical protein BaRGS_015452 [Batillaria attramentaria]
MMYGDGSAVLNSENCVTAQKSTKQSSTKKANVCDDKSAHERMRQHAYVAKAAEAARPWAGDEYKQKWEDEIDANKTLKRKHAHNVKDLTRQLQHAKKRLESYETGSGDRDATSMGSRTNSNGSLNSMDASSQHNANQHNAACCSERGSRHCLARKGGIMASVYSMHQQDGAMTLDLSLEINRKLQAVLEDTLLKNMTLKENLDTLGAEIARLSQENRRLQLHLQQLQPH